MKYLPLGSVVKLEGADRKMLIIGRAQTLLETNVLYDYSAVLYPDGFIDSKDLYVFNQEDIDTIFYVGMQDVEEFAWRGQMEKKGKSVD
jgi:hypothetical protein